MTLPPIEPMVELLGPLTHIPTGPQIAPPPQWFDFGERNPDQVDIAELQVTKSLKDVFADLKFVNQAINRLGYKADITDNWNAYVKSEMEFDKLVSFDCDDATLTKRRMLAHGGGMELGAMRPTYCQVPSAQYGASWQDHMVLLVFAKEGTIVLDNIIPWIYRWDDCPYKWVGFASTKYLWRLCGRKWAKREVVDARPEVVEMDIIHPPLKDPEGEE